MIQSKHCEKPERFLKRMQGNIIDVIDKLKVTYKIEEKKEFSKDQVENQLMLLDTTSHQTPLPPQFSANKTEETKFPDQIWKIK